MKAPLNEIESFDSILISFSFFILLCLLIALVIKSLEALRESVLYALAEDIDKGELDNASMLINGVLIGAKPAPANKDSSRMYKLLLERLLY